MDVWVCVCVCVCVGGCDKRRGRRVRLHLVVSGTLTDVFSPQNALEIPQVGDVGVGVWMCGCVCDVCVCVGDDVPLDT